MREHKAYRLLEISLHDIAWHDPQKRLLINSISLNRYFDGTRQGDCDDAIELDWPGYRAPCFLILCGVWRRPSCCTKVTFTTQRHTHESSTHNELSRLLRFNVLPVSFDMAPGTPASDAPRVRPIDCAFSAVTRNQLQLLCPNVTCNPQVSPSAAACSAKSTC